MRRYERVRQLPPDVRVTRTYLSEGGCVTYDFAFDDVATASLVGQLDSALRVPAAPRAGGRGRGPVGPQLVRRRRAAMRGRHAVTVAPASAPHHRPGRRHHVCSSPVVRLLGSRRGWGTALLAAVIGWGTAIVVALGVNDWEWGADELFIHLLAIGIPATMADAVALDLLARPGSLALGERAGLVVAPRPLRAAAPSDLRAAAVPRAGAAVPPRRVRPLRSAPPNDPSGPPSRWASACGACSRTPVASTSSSARSPPRASISSRVRSATSWPSCRTVCRPSRRSASRPVLEAELGAAVDEVFAEFDWEPLAAASIGQTYRGRLHTGEAVVVKVQRPDIEEMMERDLAALALLADLAQRRTTFGQGVRSGEMLAQFAEGLRAELDFRHEADAMAEMAAVLARALDGSRPEVLPRSVGPAGARPGALRGLTVERHPSARRRAIVDRADLADQLLRSTLDQVMRIGLFHADPHPGNVFALADGTLGLIDFGAVGRLDPIQQSAIVDIMVALARRDVEPAARRRRADRRPRRTRRRPSSSSAPSPGSWPSTSARAARSTPPSWRTSSRCCRASACACRPTSSCCRGRSSRSTARCACSAPTCRLSPPPPSCSTTGAGEPVVDPKEIVRDELLAMVPHLRRLPERVDRILDAHRPGRPAGAQRRRRGQPADRAHARQPVAARARRHGAASSTSAVLLVAADAGPAVAGETGLFEIFGYGGLLLGAVLVLRVVAAVVEGRHDMIERRRLADRVGAAVRTFDDRPPGERYYRHPGDVVRLVAVGRRHPRRWSLLIELADGHATTACARTSATRPPCSPVPSAQLAARRRAGRAASSCRSSSPSSSWPSAGGAAPRGGRGLAVGARRRCCSSIIDRAVDLAGPVPGALDDDSWLISTRFPSPSYVAAARGRDGRRQAVAVAWRGAEPPTGAACCSS